MIRTLRIIKVNKTYVTFSESIFPLNWWYKLKFLKEVKMEKALVTFPFNEERMLQCSIEKKWNQNDFS